MKAYKEWLKKEFYPYQKPTGKITELVNRARQQGWRAAMELIMRHEMHRYGNDFQTDKPMSVLYVFIRDELKS